MATALNIAEETRVYKIISHNNADDIAEAFRELATIVENSGMLPRHMSCTRSGENLTINVTLVRLFI